MKLKTKRILAIIISMIMIVTMAACGGSEAPQEVVPVATPEPTPEPVPEATPEPRPEPIEEPEEPDEELIAFEGRPFPFAFTAEDLYGNTVTEASLGEKELFFIHYWGTWCPPCIAEMPDLANLVRDYDNRVGFLWLLDDFDNKDGAINIMNGNDFPDSPYSITVDAWTTFDEQHPIWNWTDTGYVPTTVLIDADGNMLKQFVGAYFELYASHLDEFLDNPNSQASSVSGEPRDHFTQDQLATDEIRVFVDKSSYAPGERVNIAVTNVVWEMVMYTWVSVFHKPSGAPDSSFEETGIWGYIDNDGTYFNFVEVLTEPGDYEIRLIRRVNDNEVLIDSASFTIR